MSTYDWITDGQTLQTVFEYYDMPLLFTFSNRRGDVFLSRLDVWEDDREVWLLTPLTPEQEADLISQGEDVNTQAVFEKATTTYRLTTTKASAAVHIERLTGKEDTL